MNRLHKKGIFTLLRFLNEYNLSLVLILNREITDGEPGNNSYEILKFWPILSLAILIKRILIEKNGVTPTFFFQLIPCAESRCNLPSIEELSYMYSIKIDLNGEMIEKIRQIYFLVNSLQH